MVGTYTAEEFDINRFEMPDGGRWHELDSGELLALEPPESLHGAVVLNLTRAFGTWLHGNASDANGYAAFDIGLVVARCPDTVLRPPISFFVTGNRFAQCGETLTEEVPALVVEVASTNDRRLRMRERVRDYLSLGVQTIWVIDTDRHEVNVMKKHQASELLGQHRILSEQGLLPGFSIQVRDVFREEE
ncbi:MAG: Uma2 family endonuclease [Planctomycetaceae bacterium]